MCVYIDSHLLDVADLSVQNEYHCYCSAYSKAPLGYQILSRQQVWRHEQADNQHLQAQLPSTSQPASNPRQLPISASITADHPRLVSPLPPTSASGPSIPDGDALIYSVSPDNDPGDDFLDESPNEDPPSHSSGDDIDDIDDSIQSHQCVSHDPSEEIDAELEGEDDEDGEDPEDWPEPGSDVSDGDGEVDDDAIARPKAYEEDPAVRLAYLQCLRSHIFGGATVEQATRQLQDSLDLLDLCDSLPVIPHPATTLPTVKRRLGIYPDDYITKIPICDTCFKPYSYQQISEMVEPNCTEHRCKGTVYRIKRFRGDETETITTKRVPAKIQPYVSLIKTLRRFLLRRDFIRHLIDLSGYGARTLHDDSLMHDVHDGEQWLMDFVGLKREVAEDGTVKDRPTAPGSRQLLVRCDFGLSMMINLDWFGITKNQPHSAGALYGIFNNLHRSVRYLPQNVYMMPIPGPKEPSLEQLNYILLPFKNDLLRLYIGAWATFIISGIGK
jgi:hypothetical protein